MARLRSGRLTTGGLIVLVGVLLLLSTTDLVATENLWDYLPLVFVALGVWALVRSRFRNLTGPVMVVAVAGTFQARNLGYLTDQQVGEWWPLFVVLFGVLYVLGRSRRARGVSVDAGDAGDVSLVSVFSGTQRRVTGDGFRGGDVLAAFGGAELDPGTPRSPTRPRPSSASSPSAAPRSTSPRTGRSNSTCSASSAAARTPARRPPPPPPPAPTETPTSSSPASRCSAASRSNARLFVASPSTGRRDPRGLSPPADAHASVERRQRVDRRPPSPHTATAGPPRTPCVLRESSSSSTTSTPRHNQRALGPRHGNTNT